MSEFKISKLDGWLLVAGIALAQGCLVGVWAPIALIARIVTLCFGDIAWDYGDTFMLILTTVKSVFYIWRWKIARRFFRKHVDLPGALIRFLKAKAAASSGVFLAGLLLGGSLSGNLVLSNVIVDVLAAAIWIPYFRRSPEVRAHFTSNPPIPDCNLAKSYAPALLDVPKMAFWLLLGTAIVDGVSCFILSQIVECMEPPRHFTAAFFSELATGFLLRLSIAVAIFPGRKPNVFYLRAFKTDADNPSFKSKLNAVLGNRIRLAGIRCPRRRPSWLFQVFQFPLVALRYAGSNYFELEAGSDWLLRLNASLSDSRGAILDSREHTEGVGHEISLCARAMGPERCAVLVDAKTFDPSKLGVLSELDGATIIPVDTHSPDDGLEKLRLWAQRLPLDPAGMRAHALDFAMKKSPAHLSKSLPLWYRPWVRMGAMLIGTVGLGSLLLCTYLLFAGITSQLSSVPLFSSIIITAALTLVLVFHRVRQGLCYRTMHPQASLFDRHRKLLQPVVAVFCVCTGLLFQLGIEQRAIVTERDGEFSITLTSKWTYTSGEEGWNLAAIEHLTPVNTFLKVSVLPSAGFSIESHAKEWEAAHASMKISPMGDVVIDGGLWRVFQHEDSPDDGEVRRTRTYLCVNADRRYTMVLSSIIPYWQSAHESLERIVGSFRFNRSAPVREK